MSLARPGGNTTGVTIPREGLNAKRLQLLQEVAPGISRIAVLWIDPVAWDQSQRAASAIGVDLRSYEIQTRGDINLVLDAALGWGADAILLDSHSLFATEARRIADFAVRHQLPVMSGAGAFPKAGGLIYYGPRVLDNFARAAYYVDRVLKGTDPADLPVEQPTTFDLMINLQTAQTLGLSIPQHVLLQATEIIQ